MNAAGVEGTVEAVEDSFGLVGVELEGSVRVEAPIGEGGFGVVYRAHHSGFDAPVAVKVLRIPNALSTVQRESFLQKFKAEAQILFRLSQSSMTVVRPLGVGAVETPRGGWAPYSIIEWLDGHTLEQDLQERRRSVAGPRSLAEAIELLDPIATALAQAHDQGVVHRDVKPANIFLARVGGKTVPKLLDFGIAKLMNSGVGDASGPRTATGLHAFTPGYAAPEQWAPKLGEVSGRTDLYSLALVATELLLGEPALEGGDAMQLMHASLDRDMRPTPGCRGTSIDATVEAAFASALAVSPAGRPSSVREWWAELSGAVRRSESPLAGETDAARVLTRPVQSHEPQPEDGLVGPNGTRMATPLLLGPTGTQFAAPALLSEPHEAEPHHLLPGAPPHLRVRQEGDSDSTDAGHAGTDQRAASALQRATLSPVVAAAACLLSWFSIVAGFPVVGLLGGVAALVVARRARSTAITLVAAGIVLVVAQAYVRALVLPMM